MHDDRRIRIVLWLAVLNMGAGAGCGEPRDSGPTTTVAAPLDEVADSPALEAKNPPLDASEWPTWRGVTHQGLVGQDNTPRDWPTGQLTHMWQAELGDGWSSPVVAGGRVFITDRVEGVERVLAFDATTGKSLWMAESPVEFDPHPVGSRHGNGPKATPVVAGDEVYAVGIAGRLRCLEAATGRVAWEVDFPAEFGTRRPLAAGRSQVIGEEHVLVPVGEGEGAAVPLFGYTSSPLVEGDRLIACVGQPKGGTIAAFDRRSGKVLWKALDENVSYSSPIVCDLAGTRQVVVMTGPRVVGLDLDDGRALWSHPFQIEYDESIGTPVAAGEHVVFTATGRPLTCLRVERDGDRMAARVAWNDDDFSSYLSSPIIVGEHVYAMNDGGELGCLALTDGARRWIGGNHGYYSTPLAAADRLLLLNERGSLLVAAASQVEYQPIAEMRLTSRATWTSPALVARRLYVRHDGGLACYDLSAP